MFSREICFNDKQLEGITHHNGSAISSRFLTALHHRRARILTWKISSLKFVRLNPELSSCNRCGLVSAISNTEFSLSCWDDGDVDIEAKAKAEVELMDLK
ncbi:hypothetical protein V6N12_036207 [Hibiscus sabdariffa]|uniref:Uncharacterized protein n=1 Tax=Hibiscus sabdariffa TaxID=183260 RepID=A0ABR2ETX0_9ROSI